MTRFVIERKQWYLWMLALPIIIPLLLFVVCFVIPKILDLQDLHKSYFAIFQFFALFFVVQLPIAGPQYVVFAIGVLIRFRHKNADAIKRDSWLLPLFFIPVFIIGTYIMRKLNITSGEFSFNLQDLGAASMVVFAFSSLYVGIAHSLTTLLQITGVIRN